MLYFIELLLSCGYLNFLGSLNPESYSWILQICSRIPFTELEYAALNLCDFSLKHILLGIILYATDPHIVLFYYVFFWKLKICTGQITKSSDNEHMFWLDQYVLSSIWFDTSFTGTSNNYFYFTKIGVRVILKMCGRNSALFSPSIFMNSGIKNWTTLHALNLGKLYKKI